MINLSNVPGADGLTLSSLPYSPKPAVTGDAHAPNLQFVNAAEPHTGLPTYSGIGGYTSAIPPLTSSGTPSGAAPTAPPAGVLIDSNLADAASPSARDSNLFAPGFLKTARHPFICLFHLLFKAAALLTFLFGSFLFGGWEGDYVFSFVATCAFISMDFWTVKNITGRFLVGMRWWNHIKEDGTTEWIYESHTDPRALNLTDKTVFWTALYAWPLCWTVFFFVCLLRLEIEWLLLVLIGFVLSSANLVGYWKCSKGPQKNVVEQWATTNVLRALMSRFS